ncbi:indolepyruvate ferredoxin oxidoreductase family protein [Azospirillum sp. TSO5]|uniref:indolepyruvate ferredoxin oxidoreductase family protein n=1 Tax=Azospirillum sp. TSO5 TaxID=716760 RepID=UPI000D620720|nr:indolepyruvate ferredoxin oxidoreductase family protein [Azospirillum sp. TSO5]PWC94977.1 pyruvate ferredoxin oxidoreductase [Azospirillum sp. TSO5]
MPKGLRPEQVAAEQVAIDDGYRLDDRYARAEGQVYLSGTQALVRLLLLQAESDRRAGLNTAGFVSGYRGSPLGGLDQALWQARSQLDAHAISFVPGVNEDLGATAVMGTQQVESSGEGTVDGVFGLWYGKGPGVDRSGDVLKHANAYGSSPRGGVLAVAGDDHGCVSSSMPHQSDLAMIAWSMPVLNPSGVREFLDFGLYGYALSRFSGAWVGFKAISESVESSATVRLPSLDRGFLPVEFDPPPGGLHYRWPDLPSLAIEERLAAKVAAVKAFARVNRIDRTVLGRGGWLRIVTTGKAHLDLMEALRVLGIGPVEAAEIGLSVHKIGLSWPLEPDFALTAARGAEEILVVEEKAPVVEGQLKDLLFHLPAGERPRAVVGKTDEFGAPLLPATGELRPWIVAKALVERIRHRFPERDFSARLAELLPGEAPTAPALPRTPYFCSGCPHNSSTKVPEGSKAMAGIGCHFMASWMDRDTVGLSQMGGEGVSWIGQSRYSKRPHIFQNLGEGTYFHSGLLAIRQAVAAKVNITYKILFNDAVAMTGGQPVDGPISVDAITRQLAAEGITRIAVVSDAPEKYDSRSGLAPFTTVHHREELDAVQREMREIPGVTAIVYEQTCAAEKRRRRKRGTLADPARRMVINDLVCEGCGDCGRKSNCLSVQPKQTEFGVKRQIDQSSCNKDYSCADGFCPSFVSVMGGSLRKPNPDKVAARFADDLAALPLPHYSASDDPAEILAEILIVGIGGTGVVTIGAVLAMAAHLEGKASSVLDFMGFAQKGGAVYSYLRVAGDAARLNQARIDPKQAQLVLACDTVVAGSPDALKTVRLGRTRVVANAHVAPTGAFTRDGSKLPDAGGLLRSLRRAAGPDRVDVVDANRVVTALFGDSILANVFLMGVAFQKGLLPVGLEALTRAIELNGTGVPANLRAFAFGRLAAHRPELLKTLGAEEEAPATDLATIVERRAAFLTDYQDRAYADRYRALVERARQAEARVAPGSTALAEAVARSAFKLMAYKDEYEVARLHSNPAFRKSLEDRFEGDWKPVFHLAPPLLSRDTNGYGEPRKMALGAWILPVFRGMAAMKRLRGTALDPFGYTAERKMERALIARYEATVAEIAERLSADRLATAVELAALPQEIRGFGPVKHRAMEAVEPRWRALEQRLRERTAQAA